MRMLQIGEPLPSDMDKVWQEAIALFRSIAEHDLSARRCIRWVAEHLVKQGYTSELIPWPSMSSLKVALPEHGRLSNVKRVHIQYDDWNKSMVFEYSDYTGLDKDDRKGALKWTLTCQPSEGADIFEQFLNEHPDWARAARNK